MRINKVMYFYKALQTYTIIMYNYLLPFIAKLLIENELNLQYSLFINTGDLL